MSAVVRFKDNFDWDSFEKAVAQIFDMKTPLVVTWDFRAMSRVPWEHVSKQVAFMGRLQPLAQDHILKNIILVPSNTWKNTLNFMFGLVPPQTPVEIQVEKKNSPTFVDKSHPCLFQQLRL